MSRIKNHFHDEIIKREQEDDGVYPCAVCNQPIVTGGVCDDCRVKAKLSTIERLAKELPNILEGNRKFHKTKAPWGKRK